MSKGFGSSNSKRKKIDILNNAIQAHKGGNLKKAEELYQKHLSKNENDYICLNNLANIHKINGKAKQAAQSYQQAINSKPTYQLSYVNFSDFLIEQKDFKSAIHICEKGMIHHPKNLELLLNKAISFNYMNEYDKAIKIAKDIDLLDSKNYKVLFYLGMIHENAKYTKTSEEYFDACINVCKDNASLINKLSLTLRNNKQIKGSIKFMKAATLVNPKDINYHSNLLGLLRESGDLVEATNIAKKLIKDFPKYAPGFINYGGLLKEKGELIKAKEITENAIRIDANSDIAHLNLGVIFKDLGNLDEAIFHTRKAIEINPSIDKGLSNLASMLIDNNETEEGLQITKSILSNQPDNINANLTLANIFQIKGEIEQAERYLINCLNYNPEVYRAHFLLSLSKKYLSQDKFVNFISEKDEDKVISIIDKIDFYFARSNLAHHQKKYDEASIFLKKANDLKSKVHPTDKHIYINKSQLLIKESNEYIQKVNKLNNKTKTIFIVGMPRCGSTLIESILSTNNKVIALGEVNYLEKLFINLQNSKVNNPKDSIENLYRDRIQENIDHNSITVDKQLYNFLYSGFISHYMPECKIIHCIRNPYDNLLSIYKAHFLSGNRYSSNLYDSAEVYINHYETMNFFKNKYLDNIYTVQYDKLVQDPEQKIKDLIDWLGFKWDPSYLKPHLNKREVSTASRIQVRSPINPKSLDNWKKYKNLFKDIQPLLDRFYNE